MSRWALAIVALVSGCSLLYDGHNLRGHRDDASYVCGVTPKHIVKFVEGGTTPLGKTGRLAAGYFDGDGFVDLALASDSSDELLVLIGVGDGTFTTLAVLPTGSMPTGVVATDIDRDGHVDLAIANSGSNSLTLYFGSGDGRFGDRRDVQVGSQARTLVTGDFDRNGWPDLALMNGDGSVETVLHTTHGRDAYATGASVASTGDRALAGGDVDGDGDLDLVATGGFGTTSFSVLVNRDGMFSSSVPVALPAAGAVFSIAAIDLTGDRRADVVVPSRGDSASTVNVFVADDAGRFATPVSPMTPVDDVINQTIPCDFNGDGRADVALRGPYFPQIVTLLGNGDGTFGDPITTAEADTDHTDEMAVADVDGDGIPDELIIGDSGNLIVWFNRAD